MSRMTNTASVYTAQKTVAVSGTPEQLTSKTIPPGVKLVVKAMQSNTGTITVGGSSADALNSGTSFFGLLAGQALTFQVQNASMVWIDSTVSGEGVEVTSEI